MYLDAIVVLRTYIEESNFLCQTGFEMFPVFVDGKLGRCTHAQEQQDVRWVSPTWHSNCVTNTTPTNCVTDNTDKLCHRQHWQTVSPTRYRHAVADTQPTRCVTDTSPTNVSPTWHCIVALLTCHCSQFTDTLCHESVTDLLCLSVLIVHWALISKNRISD